MTGAGSFKDEMSACRLAPPMLSLFNRDDYATAARRTRRSLRVGFKPDRWKTYRAS
jgi:hypothetical protein